MATKIKQTAISTRYYRTIKTFAYACNILLGITSSVILCFLAVTLIYPKWLQLIKSLQAITIAYPAIGSIAFFCLVSLIQSCLGILALRRIAPTLLGSEIILFLCTLVIQGGIVHLFIYYWVTNIQNGLIYSVQLFRPGSNDSVVMSAIQSTLHCCGRASPNDYAIANEAIPLLHAPFSCCNLTKQSMSTCQDASHIPKVKNYPINWDQNKLNTDALVIPIDLAYEIGCETRLKSLVLPLVYSCFACPIFFQLLVICFGAWILHLWSKDEFEAENEPLTHLEMSHINVSENENKGEDVDEDDYNVFQDRITKHRRRKKTVN